MDSDIPQCVPEFLLRSSVSNSLFQKTITAFPLAAGDRRFKKGFLLQTIQTLLRKAAISETLLDMFELLDNLKYSIPDSLCRAYCAVAVECTVKYLVACLDDIDKNFADAVGRIWRGRVAALKERRSALVSAALTRWHDTVQDAIEDSRVRKRLAEAGLKSRSDAMNEVKTYLKEAFETTLPYVKRLMVWEKKKKSVCARDEGNVGGDDDGACMEDVAMHVENQSKEQLEERVNANQEVSSCHLTTSQRDEAIQKLNPQPKHKHSALCGCHRGVKISDPEDIRSAESWSTHDPVPSAEVRKLPESFKSSSPQDMESAKLWSKHDSVPSAKVRKLPESFKPSSTEDMESAKSWRKHDPVSSAEVRKLPESFKSSSMKLQASVNDSLLEALHTSEVVRSKLATSHRKIEPPTENQSEDVDVPDPNVYENTVPFQPNDANLGTMSSVHCNNIHQPSTMEQNRSVRTKLDDPVDSMPQAIQLRRRKRKWSALEEGTLRDGVKMLGEGNWAAIRSFHIKVFEHRTGGDLKDKWRNMRLRQ